MSVLFTSAAACTPGDNNVPDSLLGKILCGTWIPRSPSGWAHLLGLWPYAATAVAFSIAVVAGWRLAQRLGWQKMTRDAAWLEVTPPVAASPAATAQLWLLLASQLKAPGRFTLKPRRLVFEVHATPNRMRLGVLVPAGLNPSAVRRTIEKAWRGARVAETTPPRLPSTMPVRGQALGLRQPDWLPFTEDQGARSLDSDALHPMFEGLAAAGRGGAGLLQVVVQRAPRRRVKVFSVAGRDPVKAARRHGAAVRVADLLARGLRGILLGALDLIQTGPARTGSGSRPSPLSDPFHAERAKLARLKGSHGPHLLIGIRMFAAATTSGGASANVNDISGGYFAVSADFTRRRIRAAAKAAHRRWVPETSMVLATMAETAAVAGIPAEPAAYGLPAATARRRPGTADTWRTTGSTETPRDATDDDGVDPWGFA